MISHELTEKLFPFEIYQCQDCMKNEINLRLLNGIMLLRRLHNLFVSIHFDDSIIANPSELYIPFYSSEKLLFLCMGKKCSIRIRCSDPTEFDGNSLVESSLDCLIHESSIRGCIIDPILGTTETKSVSIAQIIRGVRMLDDMINFGIEEHTHIRSFIEFNSMYPDLTIPDSISESPPQEGPKITNFSFRNPFSIMELFSLLSSGIYSDDAIKAFLNGEMKEGFLKFITESMISMTAFMKQNRFQGNLPQLKIEPEIPEFLVKNYGDVSSTINIIFQNFRNFLKLFRKILRRLYEIDDSSLSIDLFQYCRFLYATLHVSNLDIYQRLAQQIPYQKMSSYFKYLERYVMPASPFCVEIFATVPASEKKLDKCAICWTDDSATVIGRCPQHNICCLDCFPRVVQNQKSCPTCRSPDFLP